MTDEQRGPDGPVGHTPHDSNPQMTVSVDFEAANPTGAGAAELARVSIQDPSHPGIRASLQYLVPEELGKIEAVGFTVTHLVADRPEGAPRFGPGVVKDLPIARWDRVAQAAVMQAALERSIAKVSAPLKPFRLEPDEYDAEVSGEVIATPLHVPRDRRERAVEMVRRVRPELDPDKSRGAARSWNGLVKLAEALDEYMEILASGSKDPAGEMAERHGVAQATVRTWVHRARQAGLTSTFAGWTPGGTRSTPGSAEPPARVNEAWRQLGLDLQNVRMEKNLSVEEVSSATHLRVGIIREVEDGRFEYMSGKLLGPSVIRAFARELGLDSQHLLDLFEEGRVFAEQQKKERKHG